MERETPPRSALRVDQIERRLNGQTVGARVRSKTTCEPRERNRRGGGGPQGEHLAWRHCGATRLLCAHRVARHRGSPKLPLQQGVALAQPEAWNLVSDLPHRLPNIKLRFLDRHNVQFIGEEEPRRLQNGRCAVGRKKRVVAGPLKVVERRSNSNCGVAGLILRANGLTTCWSSRFPSSLTSKKRSNGSRPSQESLGKLSEDRPPILRLTHAASLASDMSSAMPRGRSSGDFRR
eukprot:scaffold2141_cov282-Pinguiococcus_pyrenoidosus.AAC.3